MVGSNDMGCLRGLQDSGDGGDLFSPFSFFAVESLSTLVRQGVILCAPAILGGLPFAFDQPGSLQALKGDEQGACIKAKNTLTHLFEADSDPVTVHGLEGQGFQDEHVESALNEVTRFFRHRRHSP